VGPAADGQCARSVEACGNYRRIVPVVRSDLSQVTRTHLPQVALVPMSGSQRFRSVL
jgi:hypothetical protein